MASGTTGPQVSTLGRTVSYTAATNIAYLKVNAASRGGRTRISVVHDPTVAVLVSILPAFMAAIMGTIIGLRTMGPIGIIWPILFVAAGWYFYQFMTRKGRAEAARTAERMRDRVAEEIERLNSIGPALLPAPLSDEALVERLEEGLS
jgi:hypothetical protein